MKKTDENGFINFTGLDPEVSSTIDQGRQRQVSRRMTPAQRRRAEKEAARVRMTIDVPDEDFKKFFESWAEKLSVPVSSLLVYLIEAGRQVTTDDQLMEHREPTRSMRYEFILPYQKKPGKNKRG